MKVRSTILILLTLMIGSFLPFDCDARGGHGGGHRGGGHRGGGHRGHRGHAGHRGNHGHRGRNGHRGNHNRNHGHGRRGGRGHHNGHNRNRGHAITAEVGWGGGWGGWGWNGYWDGYWAGPGYCLDGWGPGLDTSVSIDNSSVVADNSQAYHCTFYDVNGTTIGSQGTDDIDSCFQGSP